MQPSPLEDAPIASNGGGEKVADRLVNRARFATIIETERRLYNRVGQLVRDDVRCGAELPSDVVGVAKTNLLTCRFPVARPLADRADSDHQRVGEQDRRRLAEV